MQKVCTKEEFSVGIYTSQLADGLLRSNSRLRHSDELSDETTFPIILPKNHTLTELIVKYHYQVERHEMGVSFTINHVREKCLVIHCRQSVGTFEDNLYNSRWHRCQ